MYFSKRVRPPSETGTKVGALQLLERLRNAGRILCSKHWDTYVNMEQYDKLRNGGVKRLAFVAKERVVGIVEVQRVFAENFGVYGVRKVWRQLRREGFTVAAAPSSG